MAEDPDAPDEAPKELHKVPSVTDEELKQFVRDFVGGRIFSIHHIPDGQLDMIPSIFMVAALGGLDNVDRSTIGTIYEYLDQAGPMAVNGFPTFLSLRMLNTEDWARAGKAIADMRDALDKIEV